ncbi:MAG TPA: acetate kinase [Acidobacteriota bacterium]|nr:acetate kinase [Acidobacteriota bacterium]HQG91213.1 acetate kinase [Acidobacteriota bacterium]HQK88314.1 acetate kinase [Acidobacteriota bacterium]
MIVLTLNCGSSTVKYKLIDTTTQKNLAVGKADRVGMMGAIIDVERPGGEKIVRETELLDHAMAISAIIRLLVEPELGILKSLDEIQAIGHRVVHGGETFTGSVRITDAVVQTLKDNIQLAPLHNPPNIVGIEAAMAILPNVPMVGVFDTAFHTTMPEHAYIYPIPYALYKKYAIRRYGFHGTSHFYVARRACEILKTKASETNLITLHLGNGASATAVRGGKSVDTTMGFTPLEGLVMGTRCGDIDPAIIIHIMDQEKISVREANNLLNKFSGLIGISGQSSDMRDLEDLYQKGDKQARLAIDIYAYRIKKYIGAYAAALGQLDCIVFTAGIGENSPLIREKSIGGLDRLGIKLDKKRNDGLRAKEAVISTDDSPVKVLVVPTNEELVIAMDTAEIVSGKKST